MAAIPFALMWPIARGAGAGLSWPLTLQAGFYTAITKTPIIQLTVNDNIEIKATATQKSSLSN